MESYNKHYIRHDEKINVIYAFSNAFEKPLISDVCISEKEGRHFNPKLFYRDGCPIYKGNMELRTEEENATWRANQPKQPTTEAEKLWDTINYLVKTIQEG